MRDVMLTVGALLFLLGTFTMLAAVALRRDDRPMYLRATDALGNEVSFGLDKDGQPNIRRVP